MTTVAAPATTTFAPEAPAPRGASIAVSGWRCPIEKQPWLHAFVQTMPGKLALLIAFTGLMMATRVPAWKYSAVALLLLTFLPQHRKVLLLLAAIAWIFILPPVIRDHADPNALTTILTQYGALQHMSYGAIAAGAAAVWGFGFGFTWFVRRFPKSPVGQRPVTTLIVLLLLLFGVTHHLRGVAWMGVGMFAMVLSQYIWFFSYTLSEPRQRDGSYPPIQAGYWRYFWAVNRCPFGKGAAYLDRIEAKDAEQLATVQLKGLKLLFWAAVLSAFRVVFTNVLYGPNSESMTRLPFWEPAALIPTYRMALDAHVAGESYAWGFRWLALIAYFLGNILDLSIWGHKLIAVARMAGFNAFRMTYRPLTATSIAEFFNRIHWYLKEMLATFFFFPTYLRYFKKYPRLRVFAATMAAACLGNFLYHFMAYDRYIFEMGLWGALVSYHHYFVYTLILGIGIGISQMRIIGKKKQAPTGWRKVVAISGVLLFYCLLSNFDNETRRDLGLGHYWSYFVSLFTP